MLFKSKFLLEKSSTQKKMPYLKEKMIFHEKRDWIVFSLFTVPFSAPNKKSLFRITSRCHIVFWVRFSERFSHILHKLTLLDFASSSGFGLQKIVRLLDHSNAQSVTSILLKKWGLTFFHIGTIVCLRAQPAYGFTPYPTMECLIDLILELRKGLGYGESQHFLQGVAITSSAFPPSVFRHTRKLCQL